MKVLKRIDQAIAKVEGWFIVLFLSLMVFLTFLQVILRGLYTHGHMQWANSLLGYVDWSEPFVRLLVLWVTFLGASLLTGENKHIKIDLTASIFPKQWIPYRNLLLCFACVVICAVMIMASIGYVKTEWEFGGELFLGIPTWLGQIILPLGFFLILFRFINMGIEQVVVIFRRKSE
ncbi:MAG: TRAP transporter small permease subunit [Deltaproteobacteria bacterium]|nr:TRAP transporter small permease subunit [Deltaproteobacteria bacterium]